MEAQQVFTQPGTAELAAAIASGDTTAIRTLAPAADLDARGDRDVTLLEWAIWNARPASLHALLQAGADPSRPGMDGQTIAHMAASVEDPEYLQVLIANNAPIDLPATATGRSPLFNAVRNRRSPQFEALLEAGADLRRIDSHGNSLLHVAGNDAALVLRLLELGVDPTLRNAQQVTFQRYFFMTPEKILDQQNKDGRQRVRDWLQGRGITVESD